jgi:hypothetical protein
MALITTAVVGRNCHPSLQCGHKPNTISVDETASAKEIVSTTTAPKCLRCGVRNHQHTICPMPTPTRHAKNSDPKDDIITCDDGQPVTMLN